MKKNNSETIFENDKTEYGLSVYTLIDPIANFYNLKIRHDHNMALWKCKGDQVELIHHWEFERISGYKKHHLAFESVKQFWEFADKLLEEYGLKHWDLNFVIGTPGIESERLYNNDFGKNLTYHSAMHLFSALLMDTDIFLNNNIIALALDGGSDAVIDKDIKKRKQFMGAVSKKGEIHYFPINSPGQLWGIAKNVFGMEEGTLMALATAVNCYSLENFQQYYIMLNEHIDIKQAGKIVREIKNKIFLYSRADENIKFRNYDSRFTEMENKISMCMKIIQQISIWMVQLTIEETLCDFDLMPQDTYLALSGGYALNCPTNTYITQYYSFKGQLIPPCAGDDGQSLGIGLYYFYKKKRIFHFKLKNAYYGNSIKEICVNCLDDEICKYIRNIDNGIQKFVCDIGNEPVLWLEGRAESGPRALGHRSILADPRKEMSKNLFIHPICLIIFCSIKISRQMYRPLCTWMEVPECRLLTEVKELFFRHY